MAINPTSHLNLGVTRLTNSLITTHTQIHLYPRLLASLMNCLFIQQRSFAQAMQNTVELKSALRVCILLLCGLFMLATPQSLAQETPQLTSKEAPTPKTLPVAIPGKSQQADAGKGQAPAVAPMTNTSADKGLQNYVVPAGRAAINIAVIVIDESIDSRGVLTRSIQRRIDDAVKDGANAIVFELNTPGGESGQSRRICDIIKSSPITNTVAWVRPQALSGGALIALAAHELIVAHPSSLGDAMPILASQRGARAVVSAELLKKALPPLLTEVTDSARQYNNRAGAYIRDEYLCQAIVANDVELWWVQNNTTGVRMAIDSAEFSLLFPNISNAGPTILASAPGTGALQLPPAVGPAAINVPAGSAKMALAAPGVSTTTASLRPTLTTADAGAWTLLGKIKDNTLPATFSAEQMSYFQLASNPLLPGTATPQAINSDTDLKSFFGATHLQRYTMSWSEHLVGLLTSRIVQGILVVIFLVALFAEMTHPGAVFPAVISAIALVCLIAPSALVGMALWWEVLAIFLGIMLVGVEILVLPGFGVAGVSGLILLFIGLIGLFVPGNTGPFPNSPQARDDMLWAAVTLVLSFGTAGFGMYFVAKHFSSIPLLGRLVLAPVGSDEESASLLASMEDQPNQYNITIGQRGTAITPMRPAGRIRIGDNVIDAVAELGFIENGQPVKVTSITPMRIGVEPA